MGLGFRVYSLGFRVCSLGLTCPVSRNAVPTVNMMRAPFEIKDSGFRVLEFRV